MNTYTKPWENLSDTHGFLMCRPVQQKYSAAEIFRALRRYTGHATGRKSVLLLDQQYAI